MSTRTTNVIGANVRVLRWDNDEIRELSQRLDRHRQEQIIQLTADQEQLRDSFRRLHERAHQIEVVDQQVQQAIGYLMETNHRLDNQVRALQDSVQQIQNSLNQAGINL